MKPQDYQKKYLYRAKLVAALLQIVPFTRMVLLNGSVAMGTTQQNSDIDLFVFLKPDRLWSGRLLVTLMVQLTGLRRYGAKIAGRICLNRYQTANHLLISPETKENARHHSLAKTLWADGKLAGKLVVANIWMRQFDFQIRQQASRLNFLRILTRPIQFLGEIIFDLFLNDWGEQTLANWQKKKIKNNPLGINSTPGEIFVSDNELRFHPKKP